MLSLFYTFFGSLKQILLFSNVSRQTHSTSRQVFSSNFVELPLNFTSFFYFWSVLIYRKPEERETMNHMKEISENEHLYNCLSSFLNQYEISDLENALKLYRSTHQTYVCKTKHSISRLNIYDICYLEIQKHNIAVHTQNEIYHKYGSLTNELKLLSPYGFLKCSKSCIVSVRKIQSIQNNDIVLLNGARIHMSRKYSSNILIAFSQNKSYKA